MVPEAVAERVAEAAAACGITLIASLPDGWITPLIARFASDARFRHVAVNREESAIGLCSGAFLSGVGSFALMGASGFLTCVYAITKINYTYQIPLLIGITLRGRPGRRRQIPSVERSLSRTGHCDDRYAVRSNRARRRHCAHNHRLSPQSRYVAAGGCRFHARSAPR